VEGKTVAERVSKVLNEGLSHIRLEDFDYLLRVDGDVVLLHNFLEENLKGKPDICGGARHAMLIKVSPFLKLMNGKFHPKSDNSYTVYKFMKEGCRIKKRKVQPIILRQAGLHQGNWFFKPKHQSVMYFYDRGKAMWRLGYEQFHVLGSSRFTFWNVFAVFGYLDALIKREKKFDVANFVWHRQVRRLLKLF